MNKPLQYPAYLIVSNVSGLYILKIKTAKINIKRKDQVWSFRLFFRFLY